MDDDDIYLPDYIQHSIDQLINFNKDCVGSLDMLFVNYKDNFNISILNCVRDYSLLHEATLCMKKSHWEKYKYKSSSKGEGKSIYGKDNKCYNTSIEKCMMCVVWDGNTFSKYNLLNNKINFKLNKEYIKILKNIFKKNGNMETDTQPNKETKIEISKELLQNIRNLIEITNERIQWKTEELLPVGIILKNIDELLKD